MEHPSSVGVPTATVREIGCGCYAEAVGPIVCCVLPEMKGILDHAGIMSCMYVWNEATLMAALVNSMVFVSRAFELKVIRSYRGAVSLALLAPITLTHTRTHIHTRTHMNISNYLKLKR